MDAGLDRTAVQLQVKGAGLRSPGVEFLRERLLLRTLAEGECCQAMVRQHEQLPALVTADVLRHHLAFVQQASAATIPGPTATRERSDRGPTVPLEPAPEPAA